MALRDDKEREKTRRNSLGSFFYDLAKTTFAVMVLGNAATWFMAEGSDLAWLLILLGTALTFSFAYIGNHILKSK